MDPIQNSREEQRLKKRTLLYALAALAFTAAAACAAGPRDVTIGLAGDAYSFDPYPLNETINNAIMQHVFEPLVDLSKDVKLLPALGKERDVNADAHGVGFSTFARGEVQQRQRLHCRRRDFLLRPRGG